MRKVLSFIPRPMLSGGLGMRIRTHQQSPNNSEASAYSYASSSLSFLIMS